VVPVTAAPVPLNLFYGEPDPDRWVPGDRWVRRVVRRVVRGRPRMSGQRRVFVNLVAGLDRLGVPYRLNDYAHARRHPEEVACIVGKPFVLDRMAWRNPILFGAAVFSHPSDDPDLLRRLPVERVLVPGEWMRRMFAPHYGADRVFAWPAGTDTEHWAPAPGTQKDVDLLVYAKPLWNPERFDRETLGPALLLAARRGLRTAVLRYGSYHEDEYRDLLARSRAMLFLCPHESQGIAYQQALSCGVPLLAWDPGGPWPDPNYYPHRVKFGPVSSVPYWDARCGVTFADLGQLEPALDRFWVGVQANSFHPRAYVLDHLTLEGSASAYLSHVAAVAAAAATAQPRVRAQPA
jgi:hypothetical protein